MKKNKFISTALPFLSLALLTGCGSGGTKYTVTWVFPEKLQAEYGYSERYSKGELPTYKRTLPESYIADDSGDYKCVFDDWSVPLDQPITHDIKIEANYKAIANITTFIFDPSGFKDTIGFKVGENEAPSKVDWGDIVEENPTADENGVYKHTYNKGIKDRYLEIDVYGPSITTISLGNQSGRYCIDNRSIMSVALGANITKIPSYAFRGINVSASILLTRCVKEVESYIAPDLTTQENPNRAGVLVPFREDEIPEGWANKKNEEWNRALYPSSTEIRPKEKLPTYYNVTDLGLYTVHKDEMNSDTYYCYSYYSYKDGGTEKAAITRAMAYQTDTNEAVTTMPIPSTIKTNYKDNVEVYALTDSCFANASGTTAVTFDENCKITNFGHSCFKATSITDFTVPDSVEYIGKDAFSYCPSLVNFDYGNSKVYTIDEATFQRSECNGLSVKLSSNIKYINLYAFNSCSYLSSIDASMIAVDAIPICDKRAFANISGNVTVTVNSQFGSAAEAKEAFAKQGWPQEKFTYTPASPSI